MGPGNRLDNLLKALAEHGIERPRPGLGQEIKARIPARLTAHRLDTINIIVDLRISRVAAAAAIILTMLLIGGFLSTRGGADMQVYEDSKLLLQYTLAGQSAGQAQFLDSLARFRDELAAQGREVVYYGRPAKRDDPCAIVMHWKLPDDRYGVILGDLTTRTVSARTLISLQAHMLQDRAK